MEVKTKNRPRTRRPLFIGATRSYKPDSVHLHGFDSLAPSEIEKATLISSVGTSAFTPEKLPAW
ncbi:hypothetical protein E4U31_007257 [Claviceps sp. LM219 group G6]|nr:hypothetical protein E4U31_007257 [Claviceps sp. LM219 group G6]